MMIPSTLDLPPDLPSNLPAGPDPTAAPLPTLPFAGRYRLDHLLGRGGMGSVYCAFDLEDARPCALKLLHQELASATDLMRFKREFRAASRLAHPFCVPVFDLGHADTPEGPRWFFTMEYLAGGSLADLLAAGPVPPGLAAVLIVQALAALDHIHSRRIVHRDIKPPNILLSGGSAAPVPIVRLSDFGIAQVADASDEVGVGCLLGSLPFLAPEQADGGRSDPRSDLYALGVVLYQLLSGHLPFQARTIAEWLRLHREVPPPALGEDIPAALRDFTARLLAKDPVDRFPSAADAYDALCACLDSVAPGLAVPPHPPLERAVCLFAPRFIGRAQELSQGRALLAGLQQGPGLLALSGEAGLGKSRLLAQLLRGAQADHVRVLPGGCRAEPDAPFAPIAALLDAVIQRSGAPGSPAAAEATEATYGSSQATPPPSTLLSALRGLIHSQAGRFASAAAAEEQGFRFQEQVIAGTLALCQAGPVLVVLEDAHWADTPTLQLLCALMRAATDAQAPLGLLLTARPAPEHTALAALLQLGARIDLHPLDAAAAAAMLDAMLGAPAAPRLRDAILSALGGNPLYLGQTLQLLLISGRLQREADGGFTLIGADGATPIGSVRDAIGDRAARLGSHTKRALAAAAVLGRRFDPRELSLVLGLEDQDEPLLLDCLDEALRAGFLEEDGFAHDHIRDALYEQLPAAERAELHRAAARAIEQVRGSVPEAAAELAHHLTMCGDLRGAFGYRLRAAEHALRSHAYTGSADHYEHALALLGRFAGSPEIAKLRGGLIERCADVSTLAGRYQRALELYDERLVGLGEVQRLGVQQRAADLCYRAGWQDEARRRVEVVAEALGALVPRDRAAQRRALPRALAAALWHELRAGRRVVDTPARRSLVKTLHTLAELRSEAGEIIGAIQAVALASAVAAQLGPCGERAINLSQQTISLVNLGWRGAARHQMAAALAMEGRCDGPVERAQMRYFLSVSMAIAGDLNGAQEHSRLALQLTEQAPAPAILANAMGIEMMTLLFAGKLDAMDEVARRALRLGQDMGSQRVQGMTLLSLGWGQLMRGERADGMRVLRDALLQLASPHLGRYRLTGAAALVWALAQGDGAERAEALELGRQVALEARHKTVKTPWCSAEGALLLAAGMWRLRGGAVDLRLRTEVAVVRTLRRGGAVGYMGPYLLAGEAAWLLSGGATQKAARRFAAAQAEARRMELGGVLAQLGQLAPLLGLPA